jgi:hypothetical protein
MPWQILEERTGASGREPLLLHETTHRTITVNAVNALEISEIRHILRGSYPRWGTGPQNVSLLKQFTTVFE